MTRQNAALASLLFSLAAFISVLIWSPPAYAQPGPGCYQQCDSGMCNPNDLIPQALQKCQAICVARCAPRPVTLPDCGMDENGSGTGQADYVEVYSSQYAKWCVDATFWPSNSQYIRQFFTYYDDIVPLLSSLFKVNIPLPIVVEVTTPTPGGAVCDCGPRFGVPEAIRITGDAFSNTFTNPLSIQSIPGFWGYLLTLHETINAFTGQVGGGGWPTDWWADQRSPFPNALDEQIMRYLGTKQNNQTLQNAASAQHERFGDPSQSGYDTEVGMFNNFFNQFGGFSAYSSFFNLVHNDGLQWVPVGQDPTYTPDNNHSPLLSEYVIAYLSLAFGTISDLTQTFAKAGVGTLDTKITSYTLSSAAVRSIANAHCSIRAAAAAHINVTVPLAALQKGNYQNAMATGGTSSSCPSECLWVSNQCVAPW